MPFFLGERSITAQDAVREGFGNEITVQLTAQTGRLTEEVNFSVFTVDVSGGHFDYLIARPRRLFAPLSDPDIWWVYDADADESESWVAQATFTDEGFIAYPNVDGEDLHTEEPWGTVAQRQAQMAAPDDEGDLIGAPARRGRTRGFTETIHDLVQADRPPAMGTALGNHLQRTREQERLPRGNSSVRDAVTRMRDLNVKDAVYADDESLNNSMLGANFVRRTASTTLFDQQAALAARPPVQTRVVEDDFELPEDDFDLPEPDPTAEQVMRDIRGEPLTPAAAPRPTVYDHLTRNLEEIRRSRPAPSVWERLAAQRKK